MMRAFSSGPHTTFTATPQRWGVQSANRARTNLATLAGVALLCAALLVGVAAFFTLPRLTMLGQEPTATPTESPTPSPTATANLPAADAAGEDLSALPRYPGSVRSDYEIALDEQYRLIVTEYLAAADFGEVRTFYQGVIAAQGWERADIGFSNGEWSWALVDGTVLALIEIEEANGLIEIDLQMSEPLAVPTPAPTEAPAAPPPPPPTPPPGDDDDDD
jgi:hypothetical protein